MKRFSVVIILLVVAIVAGAVFGRDLAQTLKPLPQPTIDPIAHIIPLLPTPTSTPYIGLPETLSIPAIGVNASVEQVGIDSLNRMDVPKHGYDVGWYDLGVRPGQTGNAVIDGHLDLVTGAPAVFWNLRDLTQGEEIIVTDDQGLQHKFRVTDIQSYPDNEFPSVQVFGQTSSKSLNLITCNGSWDAVNHNYSQRIVVYSQLES